MPKNYGHFAGRRKESDKKGGGLMIVYNDKYVRGTKKETKSDDLLNCEMEIEKFKFRLILVYMDVNDQSRNEGIRVEIKNLLDDLQPEENLVILGDFNGHLGFLGTQELDRNGKFVIELMEYYNLILINGDDRCVGETTREENGHKSAIDFVLVSSAMYRSFTDMKIDEEKNKFDLSDHCLLETKFKCSNIDQHQIIGGELTAFYSVSENMKTTFIQGLEQLIAERGSIETIQDFDGLMKENADNKIKRFFKKRTGKYEKIQPVWFNKEMKENIKLRKQYSKQWKKAVNYDDKRKYQNEYKIQKRKVQELVKEGITKYEQKITNEVKEDKNGKKLWDNIKKLRGDSTRVNENHLYDENGNIIEEDEINNKITEFWEKIYQKHVNNIHKVWNTGERTKYEGRVGSYVENETGSRYREMCNTVSRLWGVALGVRGIGEDTNGADENPFSWMSEVNFTSEDVMARLKKLKSGKQPGPNALKAELYKWLVSSEMCIDNLTQSLNNVHTVGPPIQWKESKTVMVPKKTKPMCKDLRPIALTDTSYKLYMALLKEKIVDHLMENNEFSEYQAGFTQSRRLEDNIIILSYCVQESRKMKRPLYVCAIDFEKAFDSIDRSQIARTLMKCQCDPKLIDVICELYTDDSTTIYYNNKEIGKVETTSGIRQGCTGSPLLFVMVINNIIKSLLDCGIGFKNDKVKVPCLFFADDGLLMAQNQWGLKRQIDILIERAGEIGLKINTSKSNIVIFDGQNNPENINDIKVVEEIKYLGVDICNGKDIFAQYKRRKMSAAKRMSNMTYSVISRSCNKVMVGKTYWKGVVLPSLLFGISVINWNDKEIEKLQREENNVWRKVLGAPGYTALAAMRADIGSSSMVARAMKAKLNFLKYASNSANGVLNRAVEDMFSKNYGWSRKIKLYMERTAIEGLDNLKILSTGEIARRVKEWDTKEWEKDLQSRVTLQLFRSCKKEIREEKFYDNTFGSVLLFRARSNSLKLGWRGRFEGKEVRCKLCGAEEETLEHFIVLCPSFVESRIKFEMNGIAIENILGLKEPYDMTRSKLFLGDIWMKRQSIIKNNEL